MILLHAVKSVIQYYDNTGLSPLMETFRQMTNECIRIGLRNNVTSLKRLSVLSYKELARYNILACYKICAISRAAGILAAKKKSLKRGILTKDPYTLKPILTTYLQFKIRDEALCVPVGSRQYAKLRLNDHTRHLLAETSIKARSFTITPNSLSLCISKEVSEVAPESTLGLDRNLANVTLGNQDQILQYDLSKIVDIGENHRSVMRAFRRNDARMSHRIASRHGRRKASRVKQLLHLVSKHIVQRAKATKAAISIENINDIRNLYRKGNGQRKERRSRMNNWPFHELERQIKYKARWEGVPVVQLSKAETRCTSKVCYQCGERLQGSRNKFRIRELWCSHCKRWFDRDIVAAMNISYKARMRFVRAQGAAGEAMVEEPGSVTPVILKVDAAKLNVRCVSKLSGTV